MDGGPPRFPQDFSCPVVLRIPLGSSSIFGYGVITLFDRTFQILSPNRLDTITRSYNPSVHAPRFGLFPVRSPLLGESHVDFYSWGYLDVSILPVSLLLHYFIHAGVTEVKSPCWVLPFGNPRIKACLQLPEAFRSLPRPSSPFRCLGIHLVSGLLHATISPC